MLVDVGDEVGYFGVVVEFVTGELVSYKKKLGIDLIWGNNSSMNALVFMTICTAARPTQHNSPG